MSELPILVDCPPFRMPVLRLGLCIQRYKQASGLDEATIVGIKTSACRGCPIGEERMKKHGDSQAMPEKLCPSCGKPKKRLERLSGGGWACRACKIAGKKPGPTLMETTLEKQAPLTAQASEVNAWIALRESSKSLKRQHEVELSMLSQRQADQANAQCQKVADYERAHPHVRELAKALFQEIFGGAQAIADALASPPAPVQAIDEGSGAT